MAECDNMPLRPEDDALLKDLAEAQANQLTGDLASDSEDSLIDWGGAENTADNAKHYAPDTELSAEEGDLNLGSILLQLIIVILGTTITVVLGWLFFNVL